MAERKSLPRDTTMHIDPRNIGTTLSILKNPATDTFNTHGAFRARAVPPENIRLLSKCEFKRRDHLSESLSPSVAVPAPGDLVAQSQQGQLRPSLSSLNPVIAHLVEKSKLAAADSSVEKQTKRQEIHPHVLDVMAWTKQLPCEPQCRPTQPGQRVWVKEIVLLVCGLNISSIITVIMLLLLTVDQHLIIY